MVLWLVVLRGERPAAASVVEFEAKLVGELVGIVVLVLDASETSIRCSLADSPSCCVGIA